MVFGLEKGTSNYIKLFILMIFGTYTIFMKKLQDFLIHLSESLANEDFH